MFARFLKFVRRHKRAEETAGGVVVGRIIWVILERLGWVGAGIAAAATMAALTGSAHQHIKMVAAPRGLALPTATQRALVRNAHRYGPGSGIVYVWGGSSPFGFDCSGYVNFVYRKVGIRIPRDSRSQWTYGGHDVRRGQERPGDAVYFLGSRTGANAGPPPGHEGMYIGHGKYIEYYSSGRPAAVRYLRYATDYMGAKRWYKPVQIPYRYRHVVIWVARHFHLKIAHSRGYEVTFRRAHGKMARWRLNAIRSWSHKHEPYFSGNRHYVTIKF